MSDTSDLRRPVAALAIAFAFTTIITAALAGAKEKDLHRFVGGNDGRHSAGALIADSSGTLFGTTISGGGGSECFEGKDYGCGTVFEISKTGTESVLHAFIGGCDGASPAGSLVSDSGDNLYGATTNGGVCNSDDGYGTVFKLAPGGAETVLYAFQGGSDGSDPVGSVVGDTVGDVFGATVYGGVADGCGGPGCGVVFEVSSEGVETVLHTFQGATDGSQPAGGVIVDNSGNLFGTTSEGGGSANCVAGCGTVFEVAADGVESILHVFQGGTDGCLPMAGLIVDNAGNFYGTTEGCGAVGHGTVFKLAPDGSETILHSFQTGSDGEDPIAALAMDESGNLYGTTPVGGATGCKLRGSCGTVFEVTAKGSEKVLYAFHKVRGSYPAAGLLLGAHGDLYGTTLEGGKGNNGVVFELKK